MIKVDKGIVSVVGPHPIVMAELSTLVHEMYFGVLIKNAGMSPEEAKAEINHAVEMGFMTEEKAEEVANEIARKALTAFINALMSGSTKQHGKDEE